MSESRKVRVVVLGLGSLSATALAALLSAAQVSGVELTDAAVDHEPTERGDAPTFGELREKLAENKRHLSLSLGAVCLDSITNIEAALSSVTIESPEALPYEPNEWLLRPALPRVSDSTTQNAKGTNWLTMRQGFV